MEITAGSALLCVYNLIRQEDKVDYLDKEIYKFYLKQSIIDRYVLSCYVLHLHLKVAVSQCVK